MKKNFKVLALALLSVMILGVVGCGGDTPATPKGAVENFVKAFKTLDAEAIKKTVTNPEELGELDVSDEEIATLKPLFGALEIKDLTEKIDGDKATVTGKLVAIDFMQVLPMLFEKMMDVPEAEMEKKMVEELANIAGSKDAPKTTTEVTFQVKKVGDKWLVDTEATNMDAFMGATLGGMEP